MMGNRLNIKAFIFLLLIPLYLLVKDIEFLSIISTLVYVILGINNYNKNKILSFIDIWNLAFIYIVIAEMIQIKDLFVSFKYDAISYIFISNAVINLAFYINFNSSSLIIKSRNKIKTTIVTKKQIHYLNWILLLFALVFFLSNIEKALQAFYSSRAELLGSSLGGASLKGSIISSFGSTIPVISAYMLRYQQNYKYKIYFMLVMILIVTPQFFWGTRYALLYSVLAPIILMLDNKKLNIKSTISVFLMFLLLVFASDFIVDSRSSFSVKDSSNTGIEKLASYGSNEGVVVGTLSIMDYSKKNGLSYGKESIFPLYFWVPRQWWSDKPTQLSYWLPREYHSNLSDAYSGAYGYWGELLMDFGAFFSIPFFFLLGLLFSKLEKNKYLYIYTQSYKMSIYYVTMGGAFFAVRSPQTVIPSLVFSYLFYYLFHKYISKKNKKNIINSCL